MIDREQLLDKLLRAYMHAAVDRLLQTETPEPSRQRPGAISAEQHDHGKAIAHAEVITSTQPRATD